MDRLKAWWSHAFAVEGPEEEPAAEDRELVERLAQFVVRRRMTASVPDWRGNSLKTHGRPVQSGSMARLRQYWR